MSSLQDAPRHPDWPVPVTELERIPAPRREVFDREYLSRSRPVVLSGLTEGWVPAAEWTFARMRERYGAARVVAAVLEKGTLFDDPSSGVVFRRIGLGDFVEAAAQPGSAGDYVMSPIWTLPPEFHQDYRVPGYCEGARHLRAKLWLGKAGTVTPFHRDVPHNLNVHLTGRKRWLLVPPGDTSRMYSRGLFSGMPNFSEVDPEHYDRRRHPLFAGVQAYAATVGPGETLFIPHGWWHHTRSLDDAVAMNFWWGGPLVALASLASTIFKRVSGIRREEWG